MNQNVTVEDAPQMQRDVEAFVRLVEVEWNHPLEEGFNPDIHFMAHLWEPLRCVPPSSLHALHTLQSDCSQPFLRHILQQTSKSVGNSSVASAPNQHTIADIHSPDIHSPDIMF
jgi:hypothetical protein